MKQEFSFEASPAWMDSDCHCRACGMPSEHVLVSKGAIHYTYPCCDNETCRETVRFQIIDSESRAFPSLVNRTQPFIVRWLRVSMRIISRAVKQYDREMADMYDQRPELRRQNLEDMQDLS